MSGRRIFPGPNYDPVLSFTGRPECTELELFPVKIVQHSPSVAEQNLQSILVPAHQRRTSAAKKSSVSSKSNYSSGDRSGTEEHTESYKQRVSFKDCANTRSACEIDHEMRDQDARSDVVFRRASRSNSYEDPQDDSGLLKGRRRSSSADLVGIESLKTSHVIDEPAASSLSSVSEQPGARSAQLLNNHLKCNEGSIKNREELSHFNKLRLDHSFRASRKQATTGRNRLAACNEPELSIWTSLVENSVAKPELDTGIEKLKSRQNLETRDVARTAGNLSSLDDPMKYQRLEQKGRFLSFADEKGRTMTHVTLLKITYFSARRHQIFDKKKLCNILCACFVSTVLIGAVSYWILL